MARKPHVVGGLEFTSIDKLIIYTKHILDRSRWLNSGDDFNWLIELLKRHPNWEEKNGCGICQLIITKDHNGSYHMTLVRHDDTRDTISWKSACTGRGMSPRQEKLWAYRKEIEDQIAAFRSKTSSIVNCAHCGGFFSEAPHVDHTPPFSKLVSDFETINEEIVAFSEYHAKNATLKLLCRPCNMEKGASL